jgi:hypothetical protein
MWLRAHFTMTLRKRHPEDISGEHRAVIELAVTMQYELDIHDVVPSTLREKELKERVNKELKGGAIFYAYAKAELQTYNMKKGLKAWFKREKWWFSAMVVTSLLCSSLWMVPDIGFYFFWFWCFGLWVAQVCAFCVGTTNGSKALITLFLCVLCAIVVISLHESSGT